MAAPSPSTPPGMRPPLTVESEVDHSGLITIITAFAMFLTLGSLGIRVYSAYIRRTLQMDDWTFGATAAISLVQTSVVFVSVHFGWGKTSSLITMKSQMEKAVYSADLLYVAILVLSKASTSLFYRTITIRSSHWIIYFLLGVIILWGPAAMAVLAVRCSGRPWSDFSAKCEIMFPRWQAITAIDIILETTLVLYPIRVISRLHTTLSKKVIVVLILGCRVLLIPIAAVHLYYIHQQIQSPNPPLEGAFATVTAEIHVAISVLVLIAPLMKPFIAAYVDENGLAYTDDASKSRSPHSSRSRTILGISSRKAPDPYSWTEDESLVRSASLGADNRILKSVQISVDREAALELSDRGAGAGTSQA